MEFWDYFDETMNSRFNDPSFETQFVSWLKHHDKKSFSGQDVLRLYLNNLDPEEMAYVRAFFNDYFGPGVIRTMVDDELYWPSNYPGWMTSINDLVFSTTNLVSNIMYDIAQYFWSGTNDIWYNITGYLQESYRLAWGWSVWYGTAWDVAEHQSMIVIEGGDFSNVPWWGY